MENIQLSNILHIQEASKQGKLVMFVELKFIVPADF